MQISLKERFKSIFQKKGEGGLYFCYFSRQFQFEVRANLSVNKLVNFVLRSTMC